MRKAKVLFTFATMFLMLGFAVAALPQTGGDASVVSIGVLANRGAASCLADWEPTARYLSEKVPGKTFEIVPLDFEQINSVVENGQVDFVLANPAIYIGLEIRYGVNPISTLKNLHPNGGAYSHFAGVIFSRADRDDLHNLADLKHRRFVAVEETSLGGWLMALREFQDAGIDPYKEFASLTFAGTHDAAVFAVLNGQADAGTVRSEILERLAEEGRISLSQVRVFSHEPAEAVPFIHSTRAYPEWPMAKLRHTSGDLARQVAVSLLQMPEDSPAAIAAKCAGWGIPLNYQSVRECLKALKAWPYKDLGRISPLQAVRTFWQWILAALIGFLLMGGATITIWRLNSRLALSNDRLKTEIKWRQQVTEALEESEQFNRAIISCVGDGLFVCDKDMRFKTWNRRMEQMTGLPETGILGRSLRDVCPSICGHRIDILLEKSLSGETILSEEMRLDVQQTGNSAWVVGSFTPHLGSAGEITGVVGVITDITHRKTVEKELKASNERFSAVMEALDALVYVADMQTHELLFVNRYGRKNWGDVAGKVCWEVLQSNQSGPCSFCTNDRLLDSLGNPSGVQVWECQNTINNRWYECRDQAIRWTDGRYVRLEIATDITQRRRDRVQLEYQNRFLNHVVESLSHPFLVINVVDLSLEMANSAAGDNWKGLKCHQLTHHSEHPCGGKEHPCVVETIRRTGQPMVVEHLHYDRHGELRNVEVHGHPIFDRDGLVIQVIEYSLDITDRKRAELALQEKEEYLRTIMATVNTGVLISELETGRIVDVNPFGADLIEADSKSIIGQPWTAYLEETSGADTSLDATKACEDGQLKTAQGDALSVRLCRVNASVNSQQYTIHSFTDISDLRELFRKQSVSTELAKVLLAQVSPGFSRSSAIDERTMMHVDALLLPCLSAGGDHFFVRRLPANGLNGTGAATYLSIKDQSGHLVNCILRSIFTDLVHNTLIENGAVAELERGVEELNNRLIKGGMFAGEDFLTAIMALIDHDTLNMSYISCGHPPFLLIRGSTVMSLPAVEGPGQNLPLGTIEDIRITSGQISLRVGDKLLFYTDGLTEMPLEKRGWKLSANHLEAILSEIVSRNEGCRINKIVRELLSSVADLSGQRVEYPGTNSSDDDVTLLGLELEDASACHERVLTPVDIEDLCGQIRELACLISDQWKAAGLADSGQRIHIVLEEAVLNAWKYGHRGQPGRPITVRWREGNDFHLEVIDAGDGFNPDLVPDPTLPENMLNPSGRGVFMIKKNTDETRWYDGGRRLSAVFYKTD